MVMVVLGSLAAIAMPKYVDFKVAAANAAAKGVAGALASASAMNYANNKIDSTVTAVSDCASVAGLLVGGVASNFTIAARAADATTTPPTLAACSVTNSDGGTPAVWTISN